MLRKAVSFGVALVLSMGAVAHAQIGNPFASVAYGVGPACPFDCDSVSLWVAGELTSTAWSEPILVEWRRDGNQIHAVLQVDYDPNPTLPVLVPFRLEVPLGMLPEGPYEVTWEIWATNPILTMPTIPFFFDDAFRVAPPGDLTCDGVINILDLVRLVMTVFRNAAEVDPPHRNDIDCNGTLDIFDIVRLAYHIFHGADICDPCAGFSSVPLVQPTVLPPDSLKRDRFVLESASVTGNFLTLQLAYGGGCMEHSFAVFMSPITFAESSPVQAWLYPQHVDPGDPCDAWIMETLTFDLQPIADLYILMYGSADPIQLNVVDYDQTGSISVLYVPE